MINIINKMKENSHKVNIEIEEEKGKVYFIIYIDDQPVIKIEQI